MKPRRKRDSTEAAKMSMAGKGQGSDASQGIDDGNEATAESCMANNDVNQLSTNETAGSTRPDDAVILRAAGMGDNLGRHHTSSTSPVVGIVPPEASKTRWSHSQTRDNAKEDCKVDNEKKAEINPELEALQDFESLRNCNRESPNTDECSEMRETVANSDKEMRKLSELFAGDDSDEVAECNGKAEGNNSGEKKLSRDSIKSIALQHSWTPEGGDRLASPLPREDLISIEPQIVSLLNGPDFMKHQSQEAQGNFVDNDKTKNQLIVHINISGMPNSVQSIENLRQPGHNEDNAADKCVPVEQCNVTNNIVSLANEKISYPDDIKLETHINDGDTTVDANFINAERQYSEGCQIHLNSSYLFVRKRRSIPSFDDNTPEKIRKFEKSHTGMSIWSKIEDLCDQKRREEKLYSFQQKNMTNAENVPFSHSLQDEVKLEQLPVNRDFILTKFLLNPDGLFLRYRVQRSSQITNRRCRSGIRFKAPNSDCDGEMESVMLDKSCHESRKNDHDNQMLYSSFNWSSRSRSHSSSSSGSTSSDSSHNDACLSCRQPPKPPRHDSFSYNHHSCRSQRGRNQHHNHRGRPASSYLRRRIRSCSQSCSQSLTGNLYSYCKSSDIQHVFKALQLPLVVPASATTLIVAPVTGSTVVGKTPDGSSKRNDCPEKNSIPEEASSKTAPSQPEKTKEIGGLHDSISNAGNKLKSDAIETSSEINSGTSGTLSGPSPVAVNSSVSAPKHVTRNLSHRTEHAVRNMDHVDENFERQRYQQAYEHTSYNHTGYHSSADPYFSEDTGYENFEFDGADYDNFYDEGQDEYSFGQDSYHHPPQRPPGPNMHYPRRAPPQGFRGPMPQMYAPNGPNFGPRGPGMGPRPRMGPNGPMGPQGHRPQIGPGGPMGPGIRGPSRGPPYGPPRQMRPQGMRGPPAPGMMGSTGQIGRGGPYPRFGPTPRTSTPMPRHGSQTPVGPRPRMGPPVSGPPPRDGQYPPPRSGLLPRGVMLNLSQPPPNFNVAPSPALSTSTGNNAKVPDAVEPPPLPPPKPPTPKPPPPPKKEEEKKEEIKPMAPLIPPEQAEQYRRLREQARKHARKQLRKQEHRAKGEPESSDEDEDEKAKRKEYEVRLAAEREDVEKAALLAAQEEQAVSYDEGATILMPAPQPTLIQQPTYVFQHHPMTTLPSSYGLMPAAPHFVHSAHPTLHPSQLQNVQFMASPGQPQLVQLPNGQVAYASPAPMTYQAMGPMVSMSPQGMPAAGMPHQMVLSQGGMHQVPVGHPGIAVSGNHYMSHVMAAQIQAAQQQAAQQQAAQQQAAQAALQAAQVQAAQVQAAQVQAAQAQQAQNYGYVPGVHMSQHVMQAINSQGQIILVPRVARPQI